MNASTNPSASREALLERTFALYWRHRWRWLALALPIVASAAMMDYLLVRLVGTMIVPEAGPQATAAVFGMLAIVGAAWLLAGQAGTQVIALERADQAGGALPRIGEVFRDLAGRFAGTLATAVLVIVHVAALGALALGTAALLASLPLALLPKWGATDATARSISVLVLVPLLIASVVPALWWFGRHAIAIPLQTLDGGSPWHALREARRVTRGRLGTVLGLFLVTQFAGSVVVLLCRAAGSLATLLVAPDRFRPIFGEGPLRSASGEGVQLAATLVATVLVLPLMTLPFAVLCLSLRRTSGLVSHNLEK